MAAAGIVPTIIPPGFHKELENDVNIMLGDLDLNPHTIPSFSHMGSKFKIRSISVRQDDHEGNFIQNVNINWGGDYGRDVKIWNTRRGGERTMSTNFTDIPDYVRDVLRETSIIKIIRSSNQNKGRPIAFGPESYTTRYSLFDNRGGIHTFSHSHQPYAPGNYVDPGIQGEICLHVRKEETTPPPVPSNRGGSASASDPTPPPAPSNRGGSASASDPTPPPAPSGREERYRHFLREFLENFRNIRRHTRQNLHTQLRTLIIKLICGSSSSISNKYIHKFIHIHIPKTFGQIKELLETILPSDDPLLLDFLEKVDDIIDSIETMKYTLTSRKTRKSKKVRSRKTNTRKKKRRT
jgi:hypothetical protein